LPFGTNIWPKFEAKRKHEHALAVFVFLAFVTI